MTVNRFDIILAEGRSSTSTILFSSYFSLILVISSLNLFLVN